MMFVSNRRPASDPRRVTFLSALLVLLLGASVAVAQPVPVLRPATEPVAPGLSSWFQADRAWLRSLPPAERLVVPGDPGQVADLAGDQELRDRLLALARGAAADSSVAMRTADALLADRWRNRGHLGVEVTVRPATAGRDVPDTLVVAPGPVWTFGRIEVDGDDFPGRSHLLGTWLPRTGDRYDAVELAADISQVLEGAGEAGFPWARWLTREVQPDPERRAVDLVATLIPGAQAHLGPVSTSLPPGRASEFAVRTSGLRPGQLFRQSELTRAVDRLLSRDLYSRVDPPVVHLTSSRDTVGVFLPLVAREKANRFQILLGLSRDENGDSHLSGQVDLDLPNLAGTGRALAVGWRDDGSGNSRFGFKYLEPLIFGTPLDTDLALNQEVQKDLYTLFRLDNRWRLPVVALWGVELGLGWDRTTYPTGALAATRRVRARGAVLHRRGDRSRSGWEGLFAVEEAWRSAVAEADSGATSQLGQATHQRIFEVDASGEWWLGRTVGIFGRASFRELASGPGVVVPLAEQFRFGGANTLRGYRENEFNGTRAVWAAIELRVGRPLGSRLYTFYDLGYFGYNAREPLPDGGFRTVLREGWPRGFGLGILARTGAGDVSLAVGFPGTVDFDRAKLHVTLLESF